MKSTFRWLPMLSLWGIVTLTLAAAPPAPSVPSDGPKQTGENFLKTCTTPDHEYIGYCNGYVQAVHDTSAVRYCIPSGVTRVRLVELTVDLISANPRFRRALAAEAVLEVLGAYRCAR